MPGHPVYRVAVIGAGFGGIGMALALRKAGIEDILVIDKADDLGGRPGGKPLPQRRRVPRSI